MKKRILFVEDDPLLIQMYGVMLGEYRDAWEVAFAPDARQALEKLEKTPFDVVVSDIFMPGMNGTQLMKEVKRLYPKASRIILSILSEKEEVVRTMDGIHQFIAKPFDVRVLKSTLVRVCALDAYLHDDRLKALIGQVRTLPSFPSVYVEIMKELQSPNAMIESVAAIIAKDPGMTAKMLQIVNSVALGLERKVETPFEAVEHLGFGTVRSLALSAHIFSCFEGKNLKGFSIDALWQHSVRTASLARRILELEGAEPLEIEEAYIAGVLHDAGKLLLADSLPGKFQQALSLAGSKGITMSEAEMEVFGATHAGAAAYLLGLWGLAVPIVEAVAFHHNPQASETKLLSPLTAVHAANGLEHELSGRKSPQFQDGLNAAYLADVGCGDKLEAWRAEAERLLSAAPAE